MSVAGAARPARAVGGRAEARAVVVPWCQEFYNVKRRHSSAALLSPNEYEKITAIQPDAA